MHFVKPFSHVSRHLECRLQNKTNLGKTVLKMWSQICQKKVDVSTKLLLEKSAKTKKKKLSNIKAFIIFDGL